MIIRKFGVDTKKREQRFLKMEEIVQWHGVRTANNAVANDHGLNKAKSLLFPFLTHPQNLAVVLSP